MILVIIILVKIRQRRIENREANEKEIWSQTDNS